MDRLTVGRTSSVLALLWLGGCGSSLLLGPDAIHGIQGLVLIGPQCPVQSAQNPCPDLPYEASIEIVKPDGGSVTRLRSGPDGTFRVGLRPGDYTIRPESGSPFPAAGEEEVTVFEGSYTSVTINFDTGIR